MHKQACTNVCTHKHTHNSWKLLDRKYLINNKLQGKIKHLLYYCYLLTCNIMVVYSNYNNPLCYLIPTA